LGVSKIESSSFICQKFRENRREIGRNLEEQLIINNQTKKDADPQLVAA